MSIGLRIVATVLVLVAYLAAVAVTNPMITLVSGQIAGSQFENSNTSYLVFSYFSQLLYGAQAIPTVLNLTALVLIWSAPLVRAFKWLAAACAAAVIAFAPPAHAFFEKAERTEAYTIMPNESAFWIPDVGANRDSQAQLDSEAYLNQNKLAVKRFLIPHAKLGNSGGYLGWDYYVPSGRLILLDRTPYSREWVDSEHRGTSSKAEGFPCQSKEGLNITVGVSIGASVLEKDSAKFLYRFGVTPPQGNRTDGEVIFTSVYYGRSLKQVMDDVARKKVQTLTCFEIAARSFDAANAEANDIIATVEQKTREYFASVGITLDFIGWADTFSFDKDVQKAVNDHYAAEKLAAALPILQALAQLKVQEGLGQGLATKGPPIVVTPDMINALIGMVRAPTPGK